MSPVVSARVSTVGDMRILHTSDWHLGRSFHREGLLDAQGVFVDHLLQTVVAEEVDLVVVAGDVFDRALPPVDAVALAGEAFERLAASRARVVVISGNHDSAQRLGYNAGLADHAGVHFRTVPDRCHAPVLLDDPAGGAVAVYGIPYLDPEAVRARWGLEGRSHEAALGAAMTRIRRDLAARAAGTRSVVLAHAFVAGGEASESERDISVGGVQIVSPSLFDGIDYTALGHLHGRHEMTPSVRYSGSPLAYSFSEADHLKGCWLVDLPPEGAARCEFVPAPVPRPLARLRGRLEALLADPRHAGAEGSWLQVVLTDPVRPRQAMERLRTRFPHTLTIGFEPEGAGAARSDVVAPRPGRSDLDLALDFVRDVRGEAADEVEHRLLREAVEVCCDPDARDKTLAVSS